MSRAAQRQAAQAVVDSLDGSSASAMVLASKALTRLDDYERAGLAYWLAGYDPDTLLKALVSLNPEAVTA